IRDGHVTGVQTCALPISWGVRSQHESGEIPPGTDPGAPAVPALGPKLVWTTVVATVVFAAFHVVYVTRLIGLDDLATLFGLLRRSEERRVGKGGRSRWWR